MSVNEENITDVVLSTLNSSDLRLNEIMAKLIGHLHAFIREIEPSDDELMMAIEFLTNVGKKCDDKRQEYILLFDCLGITSLKDSINHRKPSGVTEATVLGPFYRRDAELFPLGSSISHGSDDGDVCYVYGKVMDQSGEPVVGAILDIWQAASNGLYEQQDISQPSMNLRGRFKTDSSGRYYFKTVKPKCYPIPGDGPVGDMLKSLGRHNFRPAHIHFIINADGFKPVTTQIFDVNDPYIFSDAVFGVKESLIVEFTAASDILVSDLNIDCEVKWVANYDFILSC